jgi:hypothetical protein
MGIMIVDSMLFAICYLLFVYGHFKEGGVVVLLAKGIGKVKGLRGP